jgi:D-cysteine desulfhydrase family pyridoxal phosphate-dependent enzyme
MTIDKLPRVRLGFLPTPVEELTRLSDLFDGPRIFIKRDDLSGLAFGGNKVRKLEFLVGEAKSFGANTLITAGALQSNHCRQTAAAAARCGLKCELLLGGPDPEVPTGNILLDKLLGATLHFSEAGRKGESLQELADAVHASGGKPYVIPYGGSNAVGGVGFVAAMQEVVKQMEMLGVAVDRIVFPSSSGGTHAGLVVGAALAGYGGKVTGIRIDKDDPMALPYKRLLPELANQIAERLGLKVSFEESQFDLSEDYLGKGYGIPGGLEREAISLLARSEGILLDPVYTGRAMGGLLEMVRLGTIGASEKVLFWHTGGSPALFAYKPESIL